MSDNELTYPVVQADSAILSAYHFPNALPTTFIYDRKGNLVRSPARRSRSAATRARSARRS